MENLLIKDIVAGDHEDEAIAFLKRQKLILQHIELINLSSKKILEEDRVDEAVFFLHRLKYVNHSIKPDIPLKPLINIMKCYPDVFSPGNYIRFMYPTFKMCIDNNTIIFKNNVILTWKVCSDNSIKLMQLVSKYPNEGHGGAIFRDFLKTFDKKHIWLKVAVNNTGAIRFYKRHNFSVVGGDVKFYRMERASE